MSYRCPSCRGIVSANGKHLTDEQLEANHKPTCPQRGVVMKENNDDEDS